MESIFDQLDKTSTGLLVTVDEVDPSLSEMTTLATSFQHFLDEGRKVALVMAGLPYNTSALLSGKSTSFLRRASRHNLGALQDYEVADAFKKTMERGGLAINDEALEKAVLCIGGLPLHVSACGFSCVEHCKRQGRRECR